MRWSFLLRSRGCRTDPAKIQRRFDEIRRKFGDFRRRFGEDLEGKTHSDFDRPDRCAPDPDPTRPEVGGGRRRVVQCPTRCERVGSGLNTNPTRTDPWTPLRTSRSKIKHFSINLWVKGCSISLSTRFSFSAFYHYSLFPLILLFLFLFVCSLYLKCFLLTIRSTPVITAKSFLPTKKDHQTARIEFF